MERWYRDRCAFGWCRGVSLLLLLCGGLAARAGSWTWTGAGDDDNWSTASNWNPAGPPGSDNDTTVIFDGFRRLTPEQNLRNAFLFGNMVFTTNAGAFQLGGTTNAFGQCAWRSLQFSGSNTSLIVLGGGSIVIHGALVTPDAGATQTLSIASGMQLQVPWIKGGQRRVVVKQGAGVLRVYEPADGEHFLEKTSTVGPEYRVEDGLVEMGTRTNRWVLNSGMNDWKAAPGEVKASYSLALGDGLGGATSAIFRLIGPPQTQVMDNNLAIAVNADGLLDYNGVQDWDPAGAICLLVSNGVVRTGGSTLYVRNGRTLDLRGSARIEGEGNGAIRFYDGATNQVDGLSTCAVLAANAALVSAANAAGVVFQVRGGTGAVPALLVTGHLGAGGAGSHLIKRGAGAMAISNLTHAVRTNRVEEGTLLINGLSRCATLSGAAQWVVLTNATLGGHGVISNAVVVLQGGVLDPGDAAVGSLTIESDLMLMDGASLVFRMTRADASSSINCDQLVLQKGVLTGLSNATFRIALQDRLNADGQTFRIISGGGNFTGQAFRAVSLTGRIGRRAVVTTGDGFVDVTIKNMLAGTCVVVR